MSNYQFIGNTTDEHVGDTISKIQTEGDYKKSTIFLEQKWQSRGVGVERNWETETLTRETKGRSNNFKIWTFPGT